MWLCPRPRSARGAYSAPTNPLAEFKGPTSKGKEGKRRETGGEGKGLGGKEGDKWMGGS